MVKKEVLVLGGGPAGVAAAIAARRSGAKVTLVERYGFLGGTATSGMYGSFCGFYTSGPKQEQVIKGIADEMLQHLARKNALLGPVRSKEMVVLLYDLPSLKLILDRMVLDAGIEVLFHSSVVKAKVEGGGIASVGVVSKSGLVDLEGEIFIDATGDADVATLAGAPYEKDPQALQPGSLMFKVSNVDMGEVLPLVISEQLHEFIKEANRSGKYDIPREDGNLIPSPHEGEVVVGFSRVSVDGTDVHSLTEAELEGRRQVQECFRFLTERVPGFKKACLSDIAFQVGIRETRRIIGEYVLTQEDVLSGAKFKDAVARCAWPIEQHLKGTRVTLLQALEGDEWYEIPYRCSLPLGVDNLLVAGRCISTTPEAQASTRVIAPSMAVGQACGTAAALCIGEGIPPRRLDVGKLQMELREQGAAL